MTDLNIRLLGCENSTTSKFIKGPDTSVWHVSGDAMEEEGVMLLPNPTRFYDTPMATFWQTGNYGRVFQGFGADNRDMQLGWQIYAGVDGDFMDWRYTDALFRMAWDYSRPSRLEFETSSSSRYMDLQLLSEPESYSGDSSGGFDPHLTHDATVITKVGGPNPNFFGRTQVVEKYCTGPSGSMSFTVDNDGDMEIWLKWTVSSSQDGTQYELPDFSLGCNEYLRQTVDAGRKWETPILMANEHVSFNADPRVEFADSALDTNVWARCKSQLLYPVPPHTKVELPVSYTGASTSDVVRLTYAAQHSRPFGVSHSKAVTP